MQDYATLFRIADRYDLTVQREPWETQFEIIERLTEQLDENIRKAINAKQELAAESHRLLARRLTARREDDTTDDTEDEHADLIQ